MSEGDTVPILLDLFAGAGGAGAGYTRAGFRVVGCDLDPKPLRHNPHECYVGDAPEVLDTLLAGGAWHGYRLSDFVAIHASPPCQSYCRSRHIRTRSNGKRGVPNAAPRLILPVRRRLERATAILPRLVWVIENVEDAWEEMPDGVRLCGTSFGLRVQRHRLFSSPTMLYAAGACRHRVGDVSVRRKHADYTGLWRHGVLYRDGRGRLRPRPQNASKSAAIAAMGIDWMTMEELGESIPPAYTEWIGRQLLAVVRANKEGAVA